MRKSVIEGGDLRNIAIICKNYMTLRHCLKGLDLAAEKYRLNHDFITSGYSAGYACINIGPIRFTISDEENSLRGVKWDLIYIDVGIDKPFRDKIKCYQQDVAYLDFNLYDIELVMENIVKNWMVIPKPEDWRKTKEPQQSEFRRITLGEDYENF